MDFLLDSDALIKLNRAGVLRTMGHYFACLVPRNVYEEVVTRGKLHKYADADEIEAALLDARIIEVAAETLANAPTGLGAGEVAILQVRSGIPGAIVISDDRRFLRVLMDQDAPFLTPADAIVLLHRRAILASEDAGAALEAMRPMIRPSAYWEARGALGEREEER